MVGMAVVEANQTSSGSLWDHPIFDDNHIIGRPQASRLETATTVGVHKTFCYRMCVPAWFKLIGPDQGTRRRVAGFSALTLYNGRPIFDLTSYFCLLCIVWE